MNDNTWLAEDGRLLKDLRTSAGLDIHEFARAASISVAQLRQLEDGGNELFYSQSIKFQLGRKLLRKLGADVVRVAEEPAPETPSLFGFEPSPAPAPSLEETLSAAPSPVLPKPEVPTVPWNKRFVPLLSGLGVLALAGVFGSQLLTPSTEPARTAVAEPTPAAMATVSPTPNTAPQDTTPAVSTAAPAVPLPTPVAVAPTPVTTPSVATETSNTRTSTASDTCDWASTPSNSFMPRGMEKPSSYVHFVANADVSLCVQDRNKKITQVQLQTGEKLTVRGTAPWRIKSQQWSGVSVFFQGYRMPVPASANTVVLNPRTEPLAEPTAQSN
jgi:transcriptional regulator with XRE-family HTH domain